MNRYAITSLVIASTALVLTCGAYAQSQTATDMPPQKFVAVSAHLTQQLDSKSAASGQAVTAKLDETFRTANGTKLPDGSQLLGHVDTVRALNASKAAELAITFDKVEMKNGTILPIKATLMRVAPEGTDVNEPETVAADSRFIEQPGTLNGVLMRSAVMSHVSGTLTSTDRDIRLGQGTEFQIALSPEPASPAAHSGN